MDFCRKLTLTGYAVQADKWLKSIGLIQGGVRQNTPATKPPRQV